MANRILRLQDVIHRTGLSRASIYEMISRQPPAFPKQIKLGVRSVGWQEDEIDGWIEDRILRARSSTHAAILLVSLLILSTNAQAMSVWDWSFDTSSNGTVSGTLITNELGYGDGNYTISAFHLDSAGTTGLPEGEWNVAAGTFSWEQAMAISSNEFIRVILGLSVLEVTGGAMLQVVYVIDDDIVRDNDNFQLTPVPIPAAAWLFMSGLVGLFWKGRKARQSIV